jgi:glycosyltransferase 2 family protein
LNKRYVTLGIVALLLAVLAYLQFRTWRDFDWATFWSMTGTANKGYLVLALVVIFTDYYFRAVRWKMLMRPTKNVPALSLLASQVIGFTAIGVLGRPGDLVRPYLVARRENIPLPSQIAVLAVERVFDTGAFALLLVVTLFFGKLDIQPFWLQRFRLAGMLILAFVVVACMVLVILWKSGDPVAEWVNRKFAAKHPVFAHSVCHKIKHFSDGLHTIHSPASFVGVLGISILVWVLIACAYWLVTQSYQNPSLHVLHPTEVVLLMSASVVGSLLQLPMVGGGSQLGTIGVLSHVFNVPRELAASCGIMLWLITFMAIVPVGLVWARFEHLNLKEVSKKSEAEAAEV